MPNEKVNIYNMYQLSLKKGPVLAPDISPLTMLDQTWFDSGKGKGSSELYRASTPWFPYLEAQHQIENVEIRKSLD